MKHEGPGSYEEAESHGEDDEAVQERLDREFIVSDSSDVE